MIINFNLEDYEDICDTYEKVFENEDVVDVEVGDDDCLIVRTRRIVIPAIQASFREAEWHTRNPDAEEDENEWEPQCSVIVEYAEHEKNPSNYISYSTCDLMYYAEGLREKLGILSADVPKLDCYIDTSEFLDE